ncbi:FAD-dependent oxidoreductase [Sutterella sp.]|uniref:FAD-dependent oxidoreductase n=1 Tax=Sutterella sp. TaxID=1981025 RepID=UPI0026DFE0D8|nr:FAD-dependent oxidoreductase [Sutterella sp.]MDO5532680.1 FAD-dependent oxidoreductase [Sutterella sp.]
MKVSRIRREVLQAIGSIGAVSSVLRLGMLAPPARAAELKEEGRDGADGMNVVQDVLVIGSGIAGLSAACAAREAGAERVLVLEKGPLAGGHSLYSSGSISLVSEKRQKPAGVEDSPEVFLEDALAFGGGVGDRAILARIGRESEAAVDWLEGMGVRFGPVFRARASTRSRCVSSIGNSAGRTYVLALMARAVKSGVRVRLESAVTGLVRSTDGLWRVSVRSGAGSDSKDSELRARAVVIAAGGFAASAKKRREAQPEIPADMRTSANPFGMLWEDAEANGMDLGRSVGAAVRTGFGLQLLPYWGGRLNDYDGGDIFVSTAGERFIDEGLPWNTISRAVMRLPGQQFFVITDSVSRKSATLGVKLANGLVTKSATVGEMARGMDVPEEVLTRTLARYNSAAAAGRDPDFGKTVFTQTIDHPPYYWGRERIFVHTTLDGLATDDEARLLDRRNRPIPGLFAAGEVVGGVFGLDRMGGAGVANCLVMGRAAGHNAAAAAGQRDGS